METCDDCGKEYLGPAYYSWDVDACSVTEFDDDGIEIEIEHECTYNICPECAGPYLEPDEENDPRRPHPDVDEILDMLARQP